MKKVQNLLLLLGLLSGPTTMAKGMPGLVVHEWGTFTSFMGSDGKLIEGLHHEDEPLPSFVFGMKRDEQESLDFPIAQFDSCQFSKMPPSYCDRRANLLNEFLPETIVSKGITQKMETPVIYFYGEEGQKVNIDIKFPKGVITQYYPQATLRVPTYKTLNEVENGHFKFDITLGKSGENKSVGPRTSPDSIWNPARAVPEANIVKDHLGNEERFIFYRGVGTFDSPLIVTSFESILHLRTKVRNAVIPNAIVLNSDGKKGNFSVVSNTTGKGSIVKVPSISEGLDFNEYVKQVKSTIAKFLIADGMYEAEALSMVNTWEKSYFHTPGTRVLYILPKRDTEEILPLKITPRPLRIERSLVGRIEIMTQTQELAYLKLLTEESNIDRNQVFGRFYEPKLRRLEQIAPENLKEKIRNLYLK